MNNRPDLIPTSLSPSILIREAYIYPSETLFTQLTNRGGDIAEPEILEDAGWDLEQVDVPRIKNSRVKYETFPDSPGCQRGPGFPSYFAMLTYASCVKLCCTHTFVSPLIVVICLIHFLSFIHQEAKWTQQDLNKYRWVDWLNLNFSNISAPSKIREILMQTLGPFTQ